MSPLQALRKFHDLQIDYRVSSLGEMVTPWGWVICQHVTISLFVVILYTSSGPTILGPLEHREAYKEFRKAVLSLIESTGGE